MYLSKLLAFIVIFVSLISCETNVNENNKLAFDDSIFNKINEGDLFPRYHDKQIPFIKKFGYHSLGGTGNAIMFYELTNGEELAVAVKHNGEFIAFVEFQDSWHERIRLNQVPWE